MQTDFCDEVFGIRWRDIMLNEKGFETEVTFRNLPISLFDSDASVEAEITSTEQAWDHWNQSNILL